MRERRRFTKLLVATLLVGVAVAIALWMSWAVTRNSASASAGLACSVKPADPGCDTGAGEVAVFRMSSLANAHAEVFGGSTYGKVVCCGGVTGLGNSCSGVYDTVLTLSRTDNAHVASDASYPTAACLSVGAGQAVNCTYGTGCGGSACLATISGSTNAHVADCDGADDYATKVCCYAGAAAVGGLAELPDVSGSSSPNYIALAGLAAAAALALTAGAWFARRRGLSTRR